MRYELGVQVYQKEGMRALYKGAVARMAIISPLFGITILGNLCRVLLFGQFWGGGVLHPSPIVESELIDVAKSDPNRHWQEFLILFDVFAAYDLQQRWLLTRM